MSQRHYFVGNTCLKELIKLGVIQRKFARESGQAAYEKEMELRDTTGVVRVTGASADSSDVPLANLDSTDGEAPAGNSLNDQFLIPSVLILESPEHYQAVVSFNSSRGDAYGWGSALEPRYKMHWRQGGERGLVLEEVKEENPFASRLCLTSAWHEAISHVERSQGVISDNYFCRLTTTRIAGFA